MSSDTLVLYLQDLYQNSGEMNQSSRLQDRAAGPRIAAKYDFFSSTPEPVAEEFAPNYRKDLRNCYSPGILGSTQRHWVEAVLTGGMKSGENREVRLCL